MSNEKIVLTYEQFKELSQPERRLLMRAAFGAPDVPPCFVSDYDLPAIRAMLVEHEDKTRVMPERWTDQLDDDLCE